MPSDVAYGLSVSWSGSSALSAQEWTGCEIQKTMTEMQISQAELLLSLNEQYDEYVSILAFGSRVQAAVEAAQVLPANMTWVCA